MLDRTRFLSFLRVNLHISSLPRRLLLESVGNEISKRKKKEKGKRGQKAAYQFKNILIAMRLVQCIIPLRLSIICI